jgi:hypothetical protein
MHYSVLRKNIRRVANKSQKPLTKNRLLDEQSSDIGHSQHYLFVTSMGYQLDVVTE